jgi:haloalkane dehalogenase
MTKEILSDKLAYPSKFVEVCGSKMHFVEAGQGDPILLLHGVPTSCYLWRNIIPQLAPLGRCIAPDLIGFGKSEKPDIAYTIFDHIKYIEEFIKVLNLKHITIVMHGWGSIIGFHYAMAHEKNCAGLAFYEAFLRSIDVSLPYQEQLVALQEQEDIADVVMDASAFIDTVLPQQVMRELTQEELIEYKRPFMQVGSGKPLLQYIKELPRGDNSTDVDNLIEDNASKLTQSYLPKLFLYSVPGYITSISTAMWAKENLPNLEIAEVGEELHMAQESCPKVMGDIISVWLQGIEQ